ncbi:VWA domain-containing protein [Salibaculum sp.]|uniref:VWA domain-containing protein n=1 Tax=Salibaculum sp. TaxID=2855480 RepID=UPI002B4990CD|nr:VWA domain-containing protein [Salibaculum sp.]HKL70480.1 VWA domain-containing protein [Salibaculum sp.]
MMRVLALCIASLLPVAALAQDRPNTILVLDGSGSMWGQIDGVNKIVIAREVVGTILDDFPQEENLGLTVYGHRTRGDCSDIETIVAPGPGTAGAIREAVNRINPRGKTPMTDAVIAAAEALRYTEEEATVILVSDGIETCNPDPCAAARALAQAGIGFTAHVVGFDVTDPEALSQMQCLAEETGGSFTTAANAEELTSALKTVAVAPEPEPEPLVVPVTFSALLDDDSLIEEPVIWDVTGESGPEAEGEVANPLDLDLREGAYTATAYWTAQEIEQSTQFVVVGEGREVTLAFEAPAPSARVIAPASAAQGDTIEIGWDGPNEDRDYITVSEPGADGYVNYTYTREGNPLMLQLPSEPGNYEVRYVRRDGREVLARADIAVTPVAASVSGPAEAGIAAEVPIEWSGPDYDSDYVTVSEPGADGYINYVYTREGTPATLKMPSRPGDYEIRYIMRQDRRVMATAPITVTDEVATLDAPDQAERGAEIAVDWQGPDRDRDYLTVSVPGEDGYVNFVYTRDGAPATLTMPSEPGDYEIRYVLRQDREVLASRPITVTDVEVVLDGPENAVAGDTIPVDWVGPDYEGDYLTVSRPDDDGYENFVYTEGGNPAMLQMPVAPGDYELRYVLRQDRQVLASQPISVTPLKATLDAQESASMGATIPVTWEGPDYEGDYLTVSRPDDDGYENFVYTEGGNPGQLTMPVEPGDYEIRYVVRQDRTVAARRPITVNSIDVLLTHDATAEAGGTLTVGWVGPDYSNDYISISRVGDDGYETYSYSRSGNPVEITVPEAPGDYEVRYILRQDRTIAARSALTVE